MKEVPLGASESQDRVNVIADNESTLVTTTVAIYAKNGHIYRNLNLVSTIVYLLLNCALQNWT